MDETKRLQLQAKLKTFCPNVYFQPPANTQLDYPCITYNRDGVNAKRANNGLYGVSQVYQVTVIDRDPDGTIGQKILKNFQMCELVAEFTLDNLYHTALNLVY